VNAEENVWARKESDIWIIRAIKEIEVG